MVKKETTDDIFLEDFSYLKPRGSIILRGKILYKESLQCWSTLNLQREIRTVFPYLKEKMGKFGYTMIYNNSHKELKDILNELEKKDLVPILLLLGRIKE